MNTNLQTTLANFASFPTEGLWMTGTLLLMAALLGVFYKTRKNPTTGGSAGIALVAAILMMENAILSWNTHKWQAETVTQILNSNKWEVTNAKTAPDGKLESFTLSAETSKTQVEVLGKPVTASAPAKSIIINGELLSLLTTNPEMAAALQEKTQIASNQL